jgi:hypothetical protein
MASITGPVYVPAPNPIVPRYGLFQVATGPLDLPINARIGGLQYEISTCNLPLGYEVECQVDHNSKVLTNGINTIVGNPFIVYSAVQCDTVGLVNWGPDRVKKFLYDQLVAGEQATVESIFSNQAQGESPGLGGNPAVVNLGNAAGPVRAIGMLESWLYARYGLPGVIHAPMLAAPYFSGSHGVEKDRSAAGIWRTDVGTAVSFGNYAGTGPTGQVPVAGDVWVYITGQVAIWRTPDSDLFVPDMGQVINRTTNVITTVMEREYVITFDCYVAAVQVTLSTTDR